MWAKPGLYLHGPHCLKQLSLTLCYSSRVHAVHFFKADDKSLWNGIHSFPLEENANRPYDVQATVDLVLQASPRSTMAA